MQRGTFVFGPHQRLFCVIASNQSHVCGWGACVCVWGWGCSARTALLMHVWDTNQHRIAYSHRAFG